ncbi:MAG: S1C family serine protease [Aureliella sp.]
MSQPIHSKLVSFAVLLSCVGLPAVQAQQVQMTEKEERKVLRSARTLSKAFNAAAEKAMPAVVKILAKTKSEGEDDAILSILSGSEEQLFDSVGSGVIVSSDGSILTNHHVIADSKRTEIRLSDGRKYEVVDTKSDPASDLAIIKIETDEELPVASLGKAENLYVGEWVIAIGSPFTLESSVSAGIVSNTRRYLTLSRTVRGQFLQTDAAINPGNSGGPLINLEGEVIGINTSISTTTGSFQGIGFAIPIERAKFISSELSEYGAVRRGYVGVRTMDLSYRIARDLDLPRTGGALVENVVPKYPADKAGLKAGDVIVEFDGQVVETAADFAALVQQSAIGEALSLKIYREGEAVELSITLEERPK